MLKFSFPWKFMPFFNDKNHIFHSSANKQIENITRLFFKKYLIFIKIVRLVKVKIHINLNQNILRYIIKLSALLNAANKRFTWNINVAHFSNVSEIVYIELKRISCVELARFYDVLWWFFEVFMRFLYFLPLYIVFCRAFQIKIYRFIFFVRN